MPATEITICPSCRLPMSTHRFMRKLVGEVELDAGIGDLLLAGIAAAWHMVQ